MRRTVERQQVHRRRSDEARDECVRRRFVELDRRRVLLDAAAIEQHHAVGHRHRLDLVVRDVDHRDAELALQRANLASHVMAKLRVEVGQRLVHQAHRRLRDDRAAERDALLLPARKLRRLAVEQRHEPEQIGDTLQSCANVVLRYVAHLEAEHDVLGDRKVREERVRLEHHRDVALRGRTARHVATADQDAPAVALLESRDQAQRRRLPAARRSEQHVERALVKRERHAVDGVHLALCGRPMLADVFGGDGRHGALPAAKCKRRDSSRTASQAPRPGRPRA